MRLEEHDPQNKPPQLRQWWRRRIIVKGALHAILHMPPPASVNVDIRPHDTHTTCTRHGGRGGVGGVPEGRLFIGDPRVEDQRGAVPFAARHCFHLLALHGLHRARNAGWLICRMDRASACHSSET